MRSETLLTPINSAVDEMLRIERLRSEMEASYRTIEMENQFRSIFETINREREMKAWIDDVQSVLNSPFLDATLSEYSLQLDSANKFFHKHIKLLKDQVEKNKEFARKVNLYDEAISFPGPSQGKEHLN